MESQVIHWDGLIHAKDSFARPRVDESATKRTSVDWESVAAPGDDLPAALAGTERPRDILAALQELEAAATAHAEWLKNWHIALMRDLGRGQPPDGDRPALDIDRWRRNPLLVPLQGNPAFEQLLEQLERMREEAESIAGRAGTDGIVPVGEYDGFMTTVLDFNAAVRQLQNEAWNRLANLDPLTGLGNRQAMLRKLKRECERQRRDSQPICVAILDLDFFKDVNDTHGHNAGDIVLRSIASLLAASIRPYDQVFRYGGEEFVVCLPNADARAAWGILERLRLKIQNWSIPIKDRLEIRRTVSAGIAPVSAETGIEVSLEKADEALYVAKRSGRNRIYVTAIDGG